MDTEVGKEERKLKKAKISLMREPKFALWSVIMMIGKTEVVDDEPTASTNGRDERYGRTFIRERTDKELAFTVLHENLHKAFKHLSTWRRLWEEDPDLTNQACDYVINLMLVDMDPTEEFIAMPRKDGKIMGLLDRRFAKMSTKQVFDILKQEKKDGGGKKGDKDGGNGGSGDPATDGSGGFDNHDWAGAKELSEEARKCPPVMRAHCPSKLISKGWARYHQRNLGGTRWVRSAVVGGSSLRKHARRDS